MPLTLPYQWSLYGSLPLHNDDSDSDDNEYDVDDDDEADSDHDNDERSSEIMRCIK